MKFKEIVNGVAVIAMLTLALITAGCDEGINMAGDVIGGGDSGEVIDSGVGETPDPTMMMGEMK